MDTGTVDTNRSFFFKCVVVNSLIILYISNIYSIYMVLGKLVKPKEINIVNLTPHDVKVFSEDGETVLAEYPATGESVRVETKTEIVGNVNGVPVSTQKYGDVIGLPKQKPNTVYLVSLVVQMAVKSDDLLSPDTSPKGAVRDNQGRIIGTKRLVK